ncbi:MAG: hypothetical protein JJ974_01095 [Phycisphaerales bacterium]|nr:hypothetical protein [Phycisphaerales bacterium]
MFVQWIVRLGLLCFCAGHSLAQGPSGTVYEGTRVVRAPERLRAPDFDPNNFRCILVGDSQVASPAGNRLRQAMRRWDLPVSGTFFVSDFGWAGQRVDMDVTSMPAILSRTIILPFQWYGIGLEDWMSHRGLEWRLSGDVDSPETPIGVFVQEMGPSNQSPWNMDWMSGETLVARIAVRTTSIVVPFVETRAVRNGVVDPGSATIHALSPEYGYAIIEQVIPATPGVTGSAGVAVYLPDGVTEQDLMVFQVLGVSIMRVDQSLRPKNGMIIGAMANPGWGYEDHLAVSDVSRRALVELVDANTLMIMLGHNSEPNDGQTVYDRHLNLLNRWHAAFDNVGMRRPALVNVVPWPIGIAGAEQRLSETEDAMRQITDEFGGMTVSFVEYFGNTVPDIFDLDRYRLDGIRVHPQDQSTAEHLAEDLESMIFGGGMLRVQGAVGRENQKGSLKRGLLKRSP